MESIAIIGAGLTGLTVGDALRNTHRVTVFEKSRGLGGRLATRRVTLEDGRELSFDHGAPMLRPERDEFAAFLRKLEKEGNVATWNGREPYYGFPGMSDLVAPLAKGLDVRRLARVDRIVADDGWTLELAPHEREGGAETGRVGPFDRVVVAVPPQQAAAIIRSVEPALASHLADEPFAPCWTLMAAFEGEAERPLELGPEANGEDIQWLVANETKAGRSAAPQCWVMQMRREWSQEHIESNREELIEVLLPIFRRHTGVESDPLYVAAHRWRHSQVIDASYDYCFVRADGTLIVCGDWCFGPLADHAYMSARGVIERLR